MKEESGAVFKTVQGWHNKTTTVSTR